MEDEREPGTEGFRFPWEDEPPAPEAPTPPAPEGRDDFTRLFGGLTEPDPTQQPPTAAWPPIEQPAPPPPPRTTALPPTAATAAWAPPAAAPAPSLASLPGAAGPGPAGGDEGDRDDGDRRRRLWITIGAPVALLALGAASFFTGMAVGAPAAPATTTAAAERPAPDEQPGFGLDTCSVEPLASARPLRSFTGTVIDTRSGKVEFSRDGTTGSRPLTTQLVFTAMAAVDVLGADYRFITQVVEGPEPGSVVLVGGGDVTLSNYTNGSVYGEAPSIIELAQNAKATYYGGTEPDPDGYDPNANGGLELLRTVYVDTSLWSGETALASWGDSRAAGTLPFMEALMVDGDRADFSVVQSPRGDDPSASASESFVAALDLQLAEGEQVLVTEGTAPEDANVLATVESQPVSVLVQQMLQLDDYTLAEALARQVAVAAGGDGSFASAAATLTAEITDLGVDTTGVAIVDGSGYSTDALLPPTVFAQVLARLDQGREGDYASVWAGLPVAAQSGVLASRFTGDAAALAGQFAGTAAQAAGGSTLVGVMPAGGRLRYAVALYGLGDVNEKAGPALDKLAAGIAACGGNLTDH